MNLLMTMLCFENANAVSELSLIIIINLPFERVLEMGSGERDETGAEFLDRNLSFSTVVKETWCRPRGQQNWGEARGEFGRNDPCKHWWHLDRLKLIL